jgi:modification methylase llaI
MRYIGNKKKLLNEIDSLLEKKQLKKEGLVFCDLFSGTATVGDYYNGFYKIISNDLLDLSFEYTRGILLGHLAKFDSLGFDPFVYFENCRIDYTKGFCFNTFSPHGGRQYFSDENAKFIDYIRDSIDKWYEEKRINSIERSYLIACLLESISKVSNVAGVYSAYLKKWDSRALKKMLYQPINIKKTKYENHVYCKNSNDLINEISGDILYIDPPYTPTQYNSQYHVLETISRNDHPDVHGVGAHRENDRLSNWCKKGYVEFEFEQLIKNARFKHIIFSYSDKGIMSQKFIESVLKRYAKPNSYIFKKIDYVKYKSTRAVVKEKIDNAKNKNHYEYLFYIEKNDSERYVSPLNYIGGKYNTLDLIINNLPERINKCYDLFGGGFTVGINIPCKSLIYNDVNKYVVNLLDFLANNHPSDTYLFIKKQIRKYKLEKGHKEAYYLLRNDYNESKDPLLLYLLICFGFEHQVRFNSKHEFNNPCGNSGFNEVMFEKLISFYLICQDKHPNFYAESFEFFENKFIKGDFVYLDPPYLGNDGVYQDGKRGFGGWSIEQELRLYSFLEDLNERGISFMLSNYDLHSKGANTLLSNFVKKNNLKVIESEKITKRNRTNRRELVIINY